jgi:hypothetical protein
MCEVFSAGIDVKAFMLDIAASDRIRGRVRHWYEANPSLEDAHLGERERR